MCLALYVQPRSFFSLETVWYFHIVSSFGARIACWQSARLVIKSLWAWILIGGTREFFSPELTLCDDFYLVSSPPCVTAVAHKRSESFCQKCRWQVTPEHLYILDPMISEWADRAVQAWFGNLSGKRAHMQLIREHLATVISACWATVDWQWHKEWNFCVQADLHLLRKKKEGKMGNKSPNLPIPQIVKLLQWVKAAIVSSSWQDQSSWPSIKNQNYLINSASFPVLIFSFIRTELTERN